MPFTNIEDTRNESYFTKTTFGGFLKSDVLLNLKKSIRTNDLATAGRWIAECHSSGYIGELFDCIEKYIIEHIGTKNPKLFKYVVTKRNEVREMIQEKGDILTIRNIPECRHIL